VQFILHDYLLGSIKIPEEPEFLKKDPSRLEKILAHAKKPLFCAAAVNATRYALLEVLKETGKPV